MSELKALQVGFSEAHTPGNKVQSLEFSTSEHK
jgi:hypothetical protein